MMSDNERKWAKRPIRAIVVGEEHASEGDGGTRGDGSGGRGSLQEWTIGTCCPRIGHLVGYWPQCCFQMRSVCWNCATMIWGPNMGKASGEGVRACLLRYVRVGFWHILSHFRGLASWEPMVLWCRISLSFCSLCKFKQSQAFQFQLFQLFFWGYQFSVSYIYYTYY